MFVRTVITGFLAASACLVAQEAAPKPSDPGWRRSEEAKPDGFLIAAGTKVPLALINSVSTKHSAEGDRIYLETVFPIMSGGRIVIPPGSYVAGTVTQVKRPGRVKGRGELFLRFDSLTLPNGVTRDFRARVGSIDGRSSEDFDKAEGKIKSEGNKSGDARNVGEATAAGASIGVIAGGATGHYGMGAGIGAAAGATAGLMGVLLSRGPDAVLAKGSTIEMVLDRPLNFEASELNFGAMQPAHVSDGPGPAPSSKNSSISRRRFPF
jgi:type IV secretion system protein VirB10